LTVTKTIAGYLLLPRSLISPYRGVDRQAFVPVITDEMVRAASNISPSTKRTHAWEFAQTTWEREAFRLYEENVLDDPEDLALIVDKSSAKRIRDIIEPYRGGHDLVLCQLIPTQGARPSENGVSVDDCTFLGCDVAYPGGDYYSAILNGLFRNPHPSLSQEFRSRLNRAGLFDSIAVSVDYLEHFRRLVLSEKNAEFVVFKLFLCGNS